MVDVTTKDIQEAAVLLRDACDHPGQFDTLAAEILKQHGGGAARYDKIEPAYRIAVLYALQAALLGRDNSGGAKDDIKGGSKTLTWLSRNWVWSVSALRFVRVHDGLMWNAKQFDSKFNHMTTKVSMSAALFKVEGRIKRFDKSVFRPGTSMVQDGGASFNLWRKSPIDPKQGDTTLWDQHLAFLFPDQTDRNHVLNWLAWVYQNQAAHPNHALLLVGEIFGTGKSWVARVMEQLFGKDNTQRPKNSSLKGEFNGWAERLKFCILEELNHIGRKEVANQLRDMITEPFFEVNIKNVPAFLTENYMAMMGITNFPDALPIDVGDRRWLVVHTPVTQAQKDAAEASGYFVRLMAALENPEFLSAVAYSLQTRDLGKYDARQNAPMTEAKAAMIDLGQDALPAWLDENRENDPLNRRVVNANEVVLMIPDDIRRETRAANVAVRKFLRSKLNGVWLDNIRVGKKVMRLWAINEVGRELAAHAGAYTPAALAAMYLADRSGKPTSAPTHTPADTFPDDLETAHDPLTGRTVH
jgi:hypothetical protein